ncbi:Uncharacterised protein [uncultured archaeon]|nr:Uncharacterised protein [uncultured archaeon]
MKPFQKNETNWNNRILLVLLILLAFVSLIVLLVFSYINYGDTTNPILKFFIEYHLEFMIAMVFVGFGVGIITYYILSGKIKEQDETIKETGKLLLNLLNSNEKEVIEYLVNNNGIANQYELTHLNGMTRLKIHRVLEKLEEKQIITRTRLGKINKIKMADNILESLKTLV